MVIFDGKNHKNDNQNEVPDFYEYTLNMNFATSLTMAISTVAVYVKNSKNIG